MTKTLSKSDFKFDDGYYAYKTPKFELCLEICLNGFDVALYDERQDLLEPKVCLDEQGYGTDIMGLMPRSEKTWKHALEVANGLFLKHRNEIGKYVILKLKGGE